MKETKDSNPEVPVGGLLLSKEDVEINSGLPVTKIKVRNTGDRPIQVGSHFHFYEVNAYLEFDRKKSFGKRLNIPATTALRFEPGDEKEVSLVPYSGKKRVIGFNNLVDGWVGVEKEHSYRPNLIHAEEKRKSLGFKSKP